MEYRNTLQLKISYQKHLLDTLPQGWIGKYRGKPAVYVTHDPERPDRCKSRHILTSKTGRKMAAAVTAYKKALNAYNSLMAQWKSMFVDEPVIIPFPLNNEESLIITPSAFYAASPNQNPKENKTPITYKGQILRSKNELLAVQEIERMGFEWKTEIMLFINGQTLYPDVTFFVPYINKVIALETDGMMGDESYEYKSHRRRNKYFKAGFNEFDDVIFFRITNYYEFDASKFRKLIEISCEINATAIIESKTTPRSYTQNLVSSRIQV